MRIPPVTQLNLSRRLPQLGMLSVMAAVASALCDASLALPAGDSGAPGIEQFQNFFKKAQSAENQKNYSLAGQIYQNLALSRNDCPPSLKARSRCRLAVIYAIAGQMDRVFVITSAISKEINQNASQDPEFMIDLDDLTDYMLAHEKDDRVGRQAIYKSLELRSAISPDHPHIIESYRHLSRYYADHKDLKEAIKCAIEAIKSEQHLPLQKQGRMVGDIGYLSALYRLNGQPVLAENEIRRALAILDHCACGAWMKSSLRFSLGQILAGQKRFSEADREYRQAILDYMKYPDRTVNIAACCQRALKEDQELSKKRSGRSQAAGKKSS